MIPKKVKMSKQEKEAEAEAITSALPRKPSEEIKEDFMAERYQNIRSVFRSIWAERNGKKEKVVAVTCGGCLAKSIFPYYKTEYDERECYCRWNIGNAWDEYGFFDEREKSVMITNSGFFCPFCGAHSTLYAWARMKYHPIAVMYSNVQEIRAVNGHTVVILWSLSKSIDREGNESFSFNGLNASFQVGGRMFRANGYENYCGNKWFIDGWLLGSGFKEIMGGVRKKCTYWNQEELDGTVEGNDGLYAVLRWGAASNWIYAERYLSLWAKAPNIENLAKTYPDFICGLLDAGHRETIYKYALKMLNLKKAKPNEICGLEKEEAKRILSIANSPENVYLYKIFRQHKIEDPERILKIYPPQARQFIEFLEDPIVKRVNPPLGKLINYMLKSNFQTIILRDYWRMTETTERKVGQSLMFPKNLGAAHDRAVERLDAEKNKEKNARIAEQAEKFKKYIFSDQETGLCIRPVRSCMELIEEGRTLCHCVATYADSVASGKTAIFFVRRIDAPKTPFYTLEYKNGRIIQDHGFRNKLQTETVLAFEAKWLKYIQGGMRDGKRNRSKANQCASA